MKDFRERLRADVEALGTAVEELRSVAWAPVVKVLTPVLDWLVRQLNRIGIR